MSIYCPFPSLFNISLTEQGLSLSHFRLVTLILWISLLNSSQFDYCEHNLDDLFNRTLLGIVAFGLLFSGSLTFQLIYIFH